MAKTSSNITHLSERRPGSGLKCHEPVEAIIFQFPGSKLTSKFLPETKPRPKGLRRAATAMLILTGAAGVYLWQHSNDGSKPSKSPVSDKTIAALPQVLSLPENKICVSALASRNGTYSAITDLAAATGNNSLSLYQEAETQIFAAESATNTTPFIQPGQELQLCQEQLPNGGTIITADVHQLAP